MCDGKSALSSSRLIFAIFAFAAPFVRPIGGGGSLSPSPGGRAPKSRCCFVFFPPPLPLLSTATCALLLPRFFGWRGGGEEIEGEATSEVRRRALLLLFPQHPKTERNFLGQEKLVVSQSVPPPRFLTKGRLVGSSVVKRSLNCCAKQ